MKKRIIAALAAALTLCSMAGCSANDVKRDGDIVIGSAEHLALSPIEVTNDNVQNSIRVFDAVTANKKNSMFSPLSLNMALGLLAEGAKGSSKEALDKYLGTDDYGAFAESYMKVVGDKYNAPSGFEDKYKNVFEIANSFWADENTPFKEEYKNAVTGKFGAEVRDLDFGDKDKTIKEINGWVNEKTHKMIPSIIADYPDDTKSVLINTIYFESRWFDEWYVDENDKETFTLLDGSTKEIPLMHKHVSSYFENDKATAFRYGYMNGLYFIGILPKETGDFTIESLDIPSLLEGETFDYDVYARMPRLKFETSLPLLEALSAAGLSEVFDPDKADLSGITDEDFCVTDVIQKTSLELDEYGTRAAAVTELMAGAGLPREEKHVVLDRPFAFMIYDEEEEQIVFLGKVTEP